MRPDRGPKVWCDGCGRWASARGVVAAFGAHLVNGRRCGTWCRPPMPSAVKAAHEARRQAGPFRPNRAARQAVAKVTREAQAHSQAAAEATLRAQLAQAKAAPADVVEVDGPAPRPGEVRL